MTDKPRWRRAFDTIEQPTAQLLHTVVNSDAFAQTLRHASASRRAVRERYQRYTASVLHMANLPTYSDIADQQRQLARVEAKIRDLDGNDP